MTWYFDNVGAQLAAIDHERPDYEALRQIEGELIHDVFVCSRMPGFPEDLREPIYQAVVNLGVETRPLALPPLDLPDITAHIRRVGRLSEDLHTVFHTLCLRQITGFSDSPLTPVQALAVVAEEELDTLVAKALEATQKSDEQGDKCL